MAKLQNSRRSFSLEKFLSIEVIGQYVATPPFQTGIHFVRVGLKRGMGNEEMGNGNVEIGLSIMQWSRNAPPSLRKALNFKRT